MRPLALIATLLGGAVFVSCGGSSFSGTTSGSTGGSGAAGGDSSVAGGGDLGGTGNNDGGQAGSTSAGPDLSQIPELYAEGACAALTTCSSIAASLLLGANDCTTLAATEFKNASLPGIQAAVNAGTVKYDPSAAAGCRDAIAAASCSYANNPFLQACENALSGTVVEGGACAIDEECEGSLYCKYDGSCPGTCAPLESADALCRSTKDCQSGLTCFVSTGTTGRCTVKPTLGQECGYDLPSDCAPQSSDAVICWGANSTTRGKCVAVNAIASQAIGSTCSVLSSSLCVSGASCQIASILLNGTCVAPASSTGSCPFAFPDPCAKDQYCTATGPNAVGQCLPLPATEQPCLTGTIQAFSNRVCAADHVCVSGTCVDYRSNDEACTSNAVCYSGRCDSQSQKCVPNQNCDIAASN